MMSCADEESATEASNRPLPSTSRKNSKSKKSEKKKTTATKEGPLRMKVRSHADTKAKKLLRKPSFYPTVTIITQTLLPLSTSPTQCQELTMVTSRGDRRATCPPRPPRATIPQSTKASTPAFEVKRISHSFSNNRAFEILSHTHLLEVSTQAL